MIDTHWPLILVPIFGAPSVLATFIMRQFFIALPVELEEAARVDGLGRFATFWRIALPLARPALGAVAIFTFLHSWNLYLEPIVFLSTPEKFTLPQALTQFVDAYGGPMWNVQLAAASLTALPVLVVFVHRPAAVHRGPRPHRTQGLTPMPLSRPAAAELRAYRPGPPGAGRLRRVLGRRPWPATARLGRDGSSSPHPGCAPSTSTT